MIEIPFTSANDAILVMQALSEPARMSAFYQPPDGAAGALIHVAAEFAPEVQALAADLPSARKSVLLAYAADLRWRKEVGGITVSGVPVATDDRAKVMITGARVAATVDPQWSTVWHGADGNTYPVDAAAMITISDEVQAHVNTGFATFAAVKADIEAGTITATAEIDAAFAV